VRGADSGYEAWRHMHQASACDAGSDHTPEQAARDSARLRGGALVKRYRGEVDSKKTGRSGSGGAPYIKAGNDLIRDAKDYPKNSPMRDALTKEGNRLKNRGKSLNHPGRRR